MNALVVIDMTNDFVKERYEEIDERTGRMVVHNGALVAPRGESIVGPIAGILIRAKRDGAVPLMVKKDHYDGFTNPQLVRTLEDKGIQNVFLVGLVQEICVFHNARGFIKRGYRTIIMNGCTVPFNEAAGSEKMAELERVGAGFLDPSAIPKLDHVLYLEDEHTDMSEEIVSGEWPMHNLYGTPGARTVREFREVLYPD